MKRLILHIVAWVGVIITIFSVLPLDMEQRYYGCRGECSERSLWLYNRIAVDSTPIDVAFIGSSHIISAIEDGILNRLEADTVNLGFCRLGRDLQYQLIQDLIEHKSPSTIYLEIRAAENNVSHPVAPYLNTTKNLLSSPIFGNPDYFTNLWKHGVYRISSFQNSMYGFTDTLSDSRSTGYPVWVDDRIWDANGYEFRPEKNESRVVKKVQGFPADYLEHIAELCMEKQVELKFIYLPSAQNIGTPVDTSFYKSIGDEVVFIPDSILCNPEYWSDSDHFNHNGARAVSNWFKNR